MSPIGGERLLGQNPLIRDVVGRLGLTDVAAFGLTWEDAVSMLPQPGYRATVDIQALRR